MKNKKLVVMMTDQNIHDREVLTNLLDSNIPIYAVIIKKKFKLAENYKNYLKNNFYNPNFYFNSNSFLDKSN